MKGPFGHLWRPPSGTDFCRAPIWHTDKSLLRKPVQQIWGRRAWMKLGSLREGHVATFGAPRGPLTADFARGKNWRTGQPLLKKLAQQIWSHFCNGYVPNARHNGRAGSTPDPGRTVGQPRWCLLRAFCCALGLHPRMQTGKGWPICTLTQPRCRAGHPGHPSEWPPNPFLPWFRPSRGTPGIATDRPLKHPTPGSPQAFFSPTEA